MIKQRKYFRLLGTGTGIRLLGTRKLAVHTNILSPFCVVIYMAK